MRDTSLQAWRELQQSGRINELQAAALKAFLEHGPGTCREVNQAARLDGLWKRASELEREGLLRAVGKRPCRVSGKRAIVWEADLHGQPATRGPKPEPYTPRAVWREVERIVSEAYGSWEAALMREEAQERLRLGLALDAPVETFGHARRVEGVLRHLRGALRLQRELMEGPQGGRNPPEPILGGDSADSADDSDQASSQLEEPSQQSATPGSPGDGTLFPVEPADDDPAVTGRYPSGKRKPRGR